MNTLIASAPDAKQTFAIADLALMIKDLPDAEAAYKKATMFPGSEDRARRGLALVAKAKDTAKEDLTLANDLARKKQLASAIDKYHSAIFGNPKVSDARLGLAQTLERLSPANSKDLKEAVVQYKAYMSLEPDLPAKQQEKLTKRIANLENKAYKLEQKEKARAT
jgi:tetratricopeptide (TPR) repeat protein